MDWRLSICNHVERVLHSQAKFSRSSGHQIRVSSIAKLPIYTRHLLKTCGWCCTKMAQSGPITEWPFRVKHCFFICLSVKQHLGPCDMNLKAFPMDVATCKLTFESFNYNKHEVHMHWVRDRPVKVLVELKHRYRQSFVDVTRSTPIKYLTDFILVDIGATAVVYVNRYIMVLKQFCCILLKIKGVSGRSMGWTDSEFLISAPSWLVHPASLPAHLPDHLYQLDLLLLGCWYRCSDAFGGQHSSG